MAGYQIKLNHVTKSKTKVLIYRSKVNLDEKILFGSIRHLTDLEVRKIMVNGALGNKNTTFTYLLAILLAIKIRILHLKLILLIMDQNGMRSSRFPSKAFTGIFLIFWPSRRVILQNKTFSSVLVFQ